MKRKTDGKQVIGDAVERTRVQFGALRHKVNYKRGEGGGEKRTR